MLSENLFLMWLSDNDYHKSLAVHANTFFWRDTKITTLFKKNNKRLFISAAIAIWHTFQPMGFHIFVIIVLLVSSAAFSTQKNVLTKSEESFSIIHIINQQFAAIHCLAHSTAVYVGKHRKQDDDGTMQGMRILKMKYSYLLFASLFMLTIKILKTIFLYNLLVFSVTVHWWMTTMSVYFYSFSVCCSIDAHNVTFMMINGECSIYSRTLLMQRYYTMHPEEFFNFRCNFFPFHFTLEWRNLRKN